MVSRAAHVARLHESNPAVRVVAVRVVPAGEEFRGAHDASVKGALRRTASFRALRENAEVLTGMLSTWVPALSSEYGVEAATFRPATNVVEDVVEAAKLLVSWAATQQGPEPTADTKQAIEAITAQVAVVEAHAVSARATATEVQKLAQTSREKAVEFHKRLVAFRRVLASVVGQHGRDYQLLCYRRVRQSDDDSDVIIGDATPSDGSTATGDAPATTTGRSEPVLTLGELAAE